MKKIILLMAIVSLSISNYVNAQATNQAPAPAQPKAPPAAPVKAPANAALAKPQPPRPGNTAEDRAKRKTDDMKKNLELSDDETAKVSAVNLKYAKKQEDISNQMQQMMKDQDADIKGALTEEHYKKYKTPMKPGMNQPNAQMMNQVKPAQGTLQAPKPAAPAPPPAPAQPK